MKYTLQSPIFDWTIELSDDTSRRTLFALALVWIVLWLCLSVVVILSVIYLYAFILPTYVGFEATLLIGIILIVIGVMK